MHNFTYTIHPATHLLHFGSLALFCPEKEKSPLSMRIIKLYRSPSHHPEPVSRQPGKPVQSKILSRKLLICSNLGTMSAETCTKGNAPERRMKEERMKPTIYNVICAILVGTASAAHASGGAEGEGSSLLLALFLGFGALIIVFQFCPGGSLFCSMIKGLFTSASKENAAPAADKPDSAS